MIFSVLAGWAEVGDGSTDVTNASTAVAAQAAASILNFGIGRSPFIGPGRPTARFVSRASARGAAAGGFLLAARAREDRGRGEPNSGELRGLGTRLRVADFTLELVAAAIAA